MNFQTYEVISMKESNETKRKTDTHQATEAVGRRKFLAASVATAAGVSLSGFPMLSLGQS